MPLGAADLTRIYQYGAYSLGNTEGELTTPDVMDLINQQITNLNAIDTAQGTTFADNIQADLDRMDTLDSTLNSSAGDRNVKILGIGSGIEYFQGGSVAGIAQEFERLRLRIARVLAQSISTGQSGGVTPLYRG